MGMSYWEDTDESIVECPICKCHFDELATDGDGNLIHTDYCSEKCEKIKAFT